MRLASYVPGELIPLPLSGSIPELPHVAKGFLGWRSKFFNWCLLFCNSSKPKLARREANSKYRQNALESCIWRGVRPALGFKQAG